MRNAPTRERFSRRSIGEVEPSRRGQLERDNKPSTRRELWAFMGLARRCAEGRKGSHREESSAARPLRTLAPVDAGTGGVWGRAVRAGPECSRWPAASGVPGDCRGAAVHNCSGFLSQPLPLPRRAASVRGCTRARHAIARGSPAVVHDRRVIASPVFRPRAVMTLRGWDIAPGPEPYSGLSRNALPDEPSAAAAGRFPARAGSTRQQRAPWRPPRDHPRSSRGGVGASSKSTPVMTSRASRRRSGRALTGRAWRWTRPAR